MLQQFFEIRPGVEAGGAILAHPGRQPRCRLLLAYALDRIAGAFAHIAVETDHVRDRTAGIAQRLEEDLVPELRAVLAIVAQQRPRTLTLLQRAAQPLAAVLVTIIALEPAQVRANEFREAVAGQALEAALA